MGRIQVIHVSLGLHLGGMERLLVEFARHVDRTRYQLHFVSLTGRGAAADAIESSGWPVTALGAPPGLRLGLATKLRSLFRSLGANIVHTHNTKPLLYSAPAARWAGVDGIVHTRHGQRMGATPRQTLLFNLAARLTDRIVSVSKDSTDLARQQGLPRNKLETIHNGVDLSAYAYREPDPAAPLLFLGRLSQEKDVATLLQAVHLLKARGCHVRLNVAGDGPDRARLVAISCELGLSNVVSFLGVQKDVGTLLHRSSLLVLPSLSEGISLALLEAMACGVPAVATSVGGNVELIEHDRSGVLVPPRQPALLADAIADLRQNPAKASHLARAARRRVEESFGITQMIDQYQSLYQAVLGTSRTHRAVA